MSTNETSELWRDYREEQKTRRLERLPKRTEEILSLSKLGFKVEQKTEYQFRINDRLDLYPIHNRYHDIEKNRRGGYKNVCEFVNRFFAK